MHVQMDETGTTHWGSCLTLPCGRPKAGRKPPRTRFPQMSHESGYDIHPGERADGERAESNERGKVLDEAEHDCLLVVSGLFLYVSHLFL
ncbi:hypothetical protein GCM10010862_50830 [Devosia nitrariae]|uniref:Uncharacterized protein n=1 Tax=Devosia nitrariae TaxID=2071872 RepID=A0ABQ5WDI4_9HYPH|nr:hypothetical protein GCM10010862_50830 [Devosia nitrariae]